MPSLSFTPQIDVPPPRTLAFTPQIDVPPARTLSFTPQIDTAEPPPPSNACYPPVCGCTLPACNGA